MSQKKIIERVKKLFNEDGKSAYEIHIEEELPIGQVYDIIEKCETANRNNKQAVYEQRIKDSA